jgi:carbon storage regulator
MLVLSRKPGERIVIPHSGLTITVVSVRGKKVRLGITAPADVAVYREEVCPVLVPGRPASSVPRRWSRSGAT